MRSVTMPYERTTLHAEVDERYHARHSDAPYVLDPNDSSHQPWIDVWLEIRNEVLVEATNYWFFEQHPEAPPHLDPDDRSQADLVAEWIRIRDEILGTGVDLPPTPATDAGDPAAVEPSTSEFDQAADRLRENIRTLLEVANLNADSEPARYVAEQLDTARSLYLGHHFDHHDVWTSPTRDFDIGVGFNNFGIQVRRVGGGSIIRMGLVGDGPSDVGGWETYNGAPTE